MAHLTYMPLSTCLGAFGMNDDEYSEEHEDFERDDPGEKALATASRSQEEGAAPDAPDVYLTVPTLHVDEINLEVEDLTAHVSLSTEVLDLLKLNVGADVHLGRVQLDVKGVEAQAELEVRLRHVAAIVERVLTTIDRNPQILEHVTRGVETATSELGSGTGQAVAELGRGGGTAVESAGEGVGEAVEATGAGAGEAVRSAADTAGEAVRATADSTSRTVENTTDSAVRGAGDALDSAEDELKEDDDDHSQEDHSDEYADLDEYADEYADEYEDTADGEYADENEAGDEDVPAERRRRERKPARSSSRARREPGTKASRTISGETDEAQAKRPGRTSRNATAREGERKQASASRKQARSRSLHATRGRAPQ